MALTTVTLTTITNLIASPPGLWIAVFERGERPVHAWATTTHWPAEGLVLDSNHTSLIPVSTAGTDPDLGPFDAYREGP